jgi:pyridoxine 4-dehydrogenase
MLGGTKSIDIFEPARIDKRVPVEDMMRTLAALVAEGKIGGIGLSEVSAATIRRAHAVHPLACVEVEVSPCAREPLSNGIAAACAELNIPIVAYCPIGRGMFTGRIRSLDDLPENDWRRNNPRFQPGVMEHNLELVDEFIKVAERKGCTPTQLSLAWVKSLSRREGMPVFIPIPGTTSVARVKENGANIELTPEEQKEIDELLEKHTIMGPRYPEAYQHLCDG